MKPSQSEIEAAHGPQGVDDTTAREVRRRANGESLIQEIDSWCGTSRKRFQFVKELHKFFRSDEICLIIRAADKSKLV